MNTERLVDVLSANLEPVGRVQFGRTLLISILTGGAAAFIIMLATVGVREDTGSPVHLEWTALKMLFALSVIVMATPALLRSMRPGLENRTIWLVPFVPFIAAVAVASGILLMDGFSAWGMMLVGASRVSSSRCLLLVTFFAATPFATVMWALRKGAPTQLKLSGAIAGVVAGGLGALAYALNCNSDTIPFIAICYSAAILLCALIGSLLGPRLLRW